MAALQVSYIQSPDDAPIVCLVGGNGTGKSQLLELIASCASRIGLAPGTVDYRGDPFKESALFELTFYIAHETCPQLDLALSAQANVAAFAENWDRTLTVRCENNKVHLTAGGCNDTTNRTIAEKIVRYLHSSEAIHYLSLDADRAYPQKVVHSHELGAAFERDWDTSNKQSSFQVTHTLYDEWFKYLLGKEIQENNKHAQQIRLARAAEGADPVYQDHFLSYRNSIRKVLPHLLFYGVDSQKREVKFDSTGNPLSFHQLSGGEREIAFLIGQIERFGLRKGLLLVDEPELHLNYDLLRSWIGFLKGSVEAGQIWLATHSLEVVEVTGSEATFLLERQEEDRLVTRVSQLSTQPVVVSLSRAIGSPAFSISTLVFVYVEGEEEIGERERYRLLCGVPKHVRFLEGGPCNEVVRRLRSLRRVANESGQAIRCGAIVDCEYRERSEIDILVADGIFVLPVHEVENFFLHPPSLRELCRKLGLEPDMADQFIRIGADERAGIWIFQSARTNRRFFDFPRPSKETFALISKMNWNVIENNIDEACGKIASADDQLSGEQQSELQRFLKMRAEVYQRRRLEPELWMYCEGKEVFRRVISQIRLADVDAGERALMTIWSGGEVELPEELRLLREYIARL